MKFSLTVPIIILSAFYISFSQAIKIKLPNLKLPKLKLPTCAVSCAQSAGDQAGCNPCAFSIRIVLRPYLTRPPHCRNNKCVCTNAESIALMTACVLLDCSEVDDDLAAAYWAAFCI